ncbi:MAG: hypothetical protein IPJ77_13900 [Planctomycetes bacterium]|nr:hypothetical protein [Planctomycetota bacterium]
MKPFLPFLLLPLVAAPSPRFAAEDKDVVQDFSKPLAAPWSVTSKTWKVEGGELRGTGDGALDYAGPLGPDFTLTFRAKTSEKANVEVKLYDETGAKELYTFAFLGKYHSVLDGVKSCILKGERFVNVDPKTWIYPGRTFDLEVRRAKGQHQMFVNGALGPFFVDEAPPGGTQFRLKILVSCEGKDDAVVIDDVKIVAKK